jgi:murein DD-endopeptidase MepM/ murein hydrolase activator NlpD
MIRILPIEPVLFLSAVALFLGACGWVEWPPRDDKPRASNRPQTFGPSSSAFADVIIVNVGKGDTVYGLSRRYRVSARAIIDVNKLRAPYVISRGQRLVLPRARDYVVKRGDSISSIASKHNENVHAIARLNVLRSPYTIYVGQNLFIPNSDRSRLGSISTSKVPAPKRNEKTAKASSKAKTVSVPPAITGKGFLWPVKGKVLSSYGGKSEGLQNDGINIAAPRGAPVRAAENGVVAYSGNELRGFGNLLLLKHTGGWITAYAHNDTLLVKRGDKIKKGQTIAKVGSSGSVQKPQLHFELRKGKKAIDPIKYLPKV